MRIAIFSDIHANLPALNACFTSMEHQKPDALYCLGDLVGYNIWPNEVIREIQKRGIATIAGNYDQGIGANSDDCGCAYRTDAEKQMGKISISYTNSIIGEPEREYIRSLPAHIRITYHINNEKLNLLLVHGSPRRINEYLFEDRTDKSLYSMMAEADADIMCFGHTHKPYHRVLSQSEIGERYRHAINVGSVGKPKDGNPQGCYVMLTILTGGEVLTENRIQVEFIRFDYDVEMAARAIENSPLPNEYASMLRTGT